jgi:hypothetical protein
LSWLWGVKERFQDVYTIKFGDKNEKFSSHQYGIPSSPMQHARPI